MKTKVKLNGTNQYKDWNDGDTGYIVGYVIGGDEKPYAVVILDKDKMAVLVAKYHLEAIGFTTQEKVGFIEPNIIDDWLEKNGDPEIAKQVEQEAKELCKQENLISSYKIKAEKWDKLADKIAKCYVDENGDELSEEDSEDIDLCTIGEIAANAFGWL